MELIVGTIALALVLIVFSALRVGRIASWRSMAMIAASTGSLRACVAFIRYCERL
jgi:hypothetical protein